MAREYEGDLHDIMEEDYRFKWCKRHGEKLEMSWGFICAPCEFEWENVVEKLVKGDGHDSIS